MHGISLAAALATAALAAATPALGSVAPLEPRPSRADEYAEGFTFVADLADGSYAFVQLSMTNIGPGSGNGACRALVARPGKPTWTAGKRYARDDWGYDKATHTLSMGQCRARAVPQQDVQLASLDPVAPQGLAPGLEVVAPFPEGEVVLRFTRGPRSQQLQAIRIDKGRFHHEVLVQASPVQATLRLGGGAAVELTGGGYADHTHSMVPPVTVAKSWVRFRALREAPHTVLLGREGTDGVFLPVYLWREGAAPEDLKAYALTRAGTGMASRWTVALGPAGGAPLATVKSGALLVRSAPLEEAGMFAGLVRPYFGSPVTYTFRATLERPGARPLAGLLEVTVQEE